LFSVTLHAIVYFWLMPAYIAFYAAPQAARATLQQTMVRLTFIMFMHLCRWGCTTSSPILSAGGEELRQSFLTLSPCRRC
jgi:hypothetical protein